MRPICAKLGVDWYHIPATWFELAGIDFVVAVYEVYNVHLTRLVGCLSASMQELTFLPGLPIRSFRDKVEWLHEGGVNAA